MINPAEQRGNIALVFSSSVSDGDRLKTSEYKRFRLFCRNFGLGITEVAAKI